MSSQKPRALMMSAGVGALASVWAPVVPAADCWGGFVGWTICASAEASRNAEPTRGFARGVASDDLPPTGLAAALVSATLLAAEIAAAASASCWAVGIG